MLIFFGILCGFFGRKLVKPIAFFTGFIAGAVLAISVVYIRAASNLTHSSNLNSAELAIVCIVSGTILGILMVAFYLYVIIALIGALFSLISAGVSHHYALKSSPMVAISAGSFILGTALASTIPSFSVAIVTSGLGSYSLSVGLDCLLKSGFNHIFAFGVGYKADAFKTDEIMGLFIFWIIMFLWMGIKQLMEKNRRLRSGKSEKKNLVPEL